MIRHDGYLVFFDDLVVDAIVAFDSVGGEETVFVYEDTGGFVFGGLGFYVIELLGVVFQHVGVGSEMGVAQFAAHFIQHLLVVLEAQLFDVCGEVVVEPGF